MVINKFKSVLLLSVIVIATFGRTGITGSGLLHKDDNVSVKSTETEGLEIPKIVSKNVPSMLLKRYSYTASYNNTTRTPNWVGWVLTSEHTDGDYVRKGHTFVEDLDVPLPRAIPNDIKESVCGYQRGHICPVGDNKWSFKAQKDAFLMTNISPQNGNLNQYDWRHLEEQCREWAIKYGKIYIVAGPIFYTKIYKTVGEHKVAVPDAFFKVILTISNNSSKEIKTIGFIYQNIAQRHKMEYYACSVDEVEKVTGFDFFYQLPDSIENVIEASSNFNEW